MVQGARSLGVSGYVRFNLSMFLENIKWWLLVSKVPRIGTPNYASLGFSHDMHILKVTQLLQPDIVSQNMKNSNFDLEIRGHCLMTPQNPVSIRMHEKMGHFLEAKPYFDLYETSFLGWKWSPWISWHLKCWQYVENNLILNTHKWI